MWDGRGDAYEPVEVPVQPAISYRLGPRWPLWLALLPVVGALALGVGIALVGFGRIEVLEAPIVPRTPVLTLPPPAPQPQPQPSPPPLAGSPVPTSTSSPPAAGPVGSTPTTAVLMPSPEAVASSSPPSPSAAGTSTTATTAAPEPEPEPERAIPRTAGDCRNGGWRELVDDAGHPFANQGHCIRFVERGGRHP